MRKTKVPLLLSCGYTQTANCYRLPHPSLTIRNFRLESLESYVKVRLKFLSKTFEIRYEQQNINLF